MATTWTPQQILAAISGLESGGSYTARNKVGTASGKYQWLDSTWNGYGGYAHAYQAPPAVQEARAVHDITDKLARYGGDVRKAIMSWFLPAAVANPALANVVPKGNTITPNQYADNIMRRLGVKVAGATPSASGAADTAVSPTGNEADGTLAGQLANIMVGMSSGRSVETQTF